MRKLVALALPGGEQFVGELQRAWDAGDAVLPVDLRLTPPAQQELVARLGAAVLVGADGRHRLKGGRPVDDGDALVVPTSGTGGEPKAAVLTHSAVAANVFATSSWLEVDPTTDCWLACLPLAHVGGLSVVARALLTDTPLMVHDGFDAGRVAQAAAQGATLTSVVPTALARIDPSAFRRVLVGGSAVPANRPENVIATYGMTETFSGVVYDGWPLEGVELRVVNGEVQLRCPMLLRCYRDGTQPFTSDGWFATGDAGELTAAGQLRVFGRLDDAIVTGGEKVWPVAVERALEGCPGIRRCAVVGRLDPEWGEAVTVVLEPCDPSAPPKLDALRDYVKRTLPAFCAPQQMELVDQLPTTALGKVRRSEL